MTATRTFAYARFSTEGQEDGTSIENQLLACRKYAESHGLTIVHEFKDEAVSGTIPMEFRPQGKLMMESINRHECEAIVMYVPDRANRDMLNSLVFLKSMKRKGIQVHYTNIGELKGYTELAAKMMDMIADEEVKNTRDRTMRGKINQVKLNKKMVFSSRIPFGYRKVGLKKEGILEINPEQAKWIKLAFEMYLQNHTLQGIADYFNTNNVVTSTGIVPSERPNGHAWQANSIYGILLNPIYKGLYIYGKTKTKEKEHDTQPYWERYVDVPEEDWATLQFPELALVSESVWDATHEKMKKNKLSSRWTARNSGFLLTGFMICPHCGHHIGSYTSKEKSNVQGTIERFKYGCRNRDCIAYSKNIMQHLVDKKVWDWIKEQIANEKILEAGINRLFQKRQAKMTDSVCRKDDLIQLINDLSKQIKKLIQSLSYFDEDAEEAKRAIANEITLLTKQKAKAEKELKSLDAIISESGASEEQKEAFFVVAKEIGKRMEQGENAPALAKRKLLEMLNLEIILDLVGKRTAEISWGFNPGTDTINMDNNNNEVDGNTDESYQVNAHSLYTIHIKSNKDNQFIRLIRFEAVLDLSI
jgi:site-specific DNA recombinase